MFLKKNETPDDVYYDYNGDADRDFFRHAGLTPPRMNVI
jgi:hypothetical protein